MSHATTVPNDTKYTHYLVLRYFVIKYFANTRIKIVIIFRPIKMAMAVLTNTSLADASAAGSFLLLVAD